MDIERMKKLLSKGIEAGRKTEAVRETVKTHQTQKQDVYEGTAEILKPSIDAQKMVKKSIDTKQDELIKQLQKNQKAIVSGLEDIAIMNALPAALPAPTGTMKLPTGYVPKMISDEEEEEEEEEEEKKVEKKKESDPDNEFTKDELERLDKLKWLRPSVLFQKYIDGEINFDEYYKELGDRSSSLGRTKGSLSQTKKSKIQNRKQIDNIDSELGLLRKYRKRIGIIPEAVKTIKGEGIKRQYGGLIINLPKLYGQLKVIAHKNGKKVYDRQADFDTLDLLTEKFNGRKKYSELARSVLNDLNRLSRSPR